MGNFWRRAVASEIGRKAPGMKLRPAVLPSACIGWIALALSFGASCGSVGTAKPEASDGLGGQEIAPESALPEGRFEGADVQLDYDPDPYAAAMRALRWLKMVQRDDGSWPGMATANTSLVILCFLAHGETPGSSAEFGPTVAAGLEYLLKNQQADGLFRQRDGNNYSHPIATYALCEAYSMTKNPLVKEAAEKALVHIIKGQHPSGGWDYNMRQSERDDTSYMSWCAQALKAAAISGELEVDRLEEACRNSVNGFRKNYHPGGGFGYTGPGKGGLSGVGVLCMQLMGGQNSEEITKTLDYLEPCKFSFVDWRKQPSGFGTSPVYYWYYITQAKLHAGGERWRSWNAQFVPELAREQQVIKDAIADETGRLRDAGFWDSPSAGEHNATGGGSVTVRVYEGGTAREIEADLGGRVMDTALLAALLAQPRSLPSFDKAVHERLEKNMEAPDPDVIKVRIIR